MINDKYGTNQSNEQNNFTLTCDGCGSNNTRIVPTGHYKEGQYSRPEKVTLTLRCLSCGENHTCDIA